MAKQTEKSPVDSLINLVLVAIALTVLVAVVVVCLPGKGSLATGWKQAWHQMTAQMGAKKETVLVDTKLPEMQLGYKVSYNDPRVQRTLNIPWAQ